MVDGVPANPKVREVDPFTGIPNPSRAKPRSSSNSKVPTVLVSWLVLSQAIARLAKPVGKLKLGRFMQGYTLLYAAMIFVGGLMGFLKKGSKFSLISSSILALLIVGILALPPKLCYPSLLAVSIPLSFFFRNKFEKSGEPKIGPGESMSNSSINAKKKFMPFGLLSIMTWIIPPLIAPLCNFWFYP